MRQQSRSQVRRARQAKAEKRHILHKDASATTSRSLHSRGQPLHATVQGGRGSSEVRQARVVQVEERGRQAGSGVYRRKCGEAGSVVAGSRQRKRQCQVARQAGFLRRVAGSR